MEISTPMKLFSLPFGLLILAIFISKPLAAQNWDQQIRSLLLDDQFEEVLAVTDTVQVPDSLMDKLNYYRGIAYQSLFKFDSAYHYYHLASIADSQNVHYLVSMGQMLTKLGRTREAVEVYENTRGQFQPGSNHLVELASLYTNRNRHKESLEIYIDLHENDPANYYYLKQAGKCFLELNRTDSALACFKTSLELNPADSYLTYQVANIYLKRKDFENAVLHLQEGFLYDSNNLDLLKLRGYIWLLSMQYEDAILDLEKARILDSSSLFINKYLGMAYHENKDFTESRQTLQQAFEIDSTDAETAYFLGSACRWSQHEEEGVIYYKKSIELRQPDPEQLKNVCLQLAELYKVLHRFDEALNAYQVALEYDPYDNTIYFKIGQMYDRNLNQKKTAIEYYEKYLSEGKTDQQLFDASEGTSTELKEHVISRITELREDLFFENQPQ